MQEPFRDSGYGLKHKQNPSDIQKFFDVLLIVRIDDFQLLVFA